MTDSYYLKTTADGAIDLRDLSMCIARAMEEIRTQGIPDKLPEGRNDRLVSIGMISITTVMLSFSLELALKGALQQAGVEPPRPRAFEIHDLEKLYDFLPKEEQDKIKEAWAEMIFLSKEAKDIGPRCFFSRHREDFVNWRYMKSPKAGILDLDMYGAIMAVNAASHRR